MKPILGTELLSDAQLVEKSCGGDREAFGQIVGRYQSLVCALTYSACGDLHVSEDLAQVTFVAAWRQLRELREPAKLKVWLCGIARNVTNDLLRRDRRTPTAHAETLDATADIPSQAPSPRDHVVSKEEEAILWGALGELSTTYREPLVLFYRQHQSTAEVAETLGLSEDAVSQRLSRGRVMLTEQVARVVETTLRNTGPTKAFTLGVLAALPVFATSAKAAAIGAAAAKGSATAKAAAFMGLAGAILGPVIGILGGLLGTKASIENTDSTRERRFMVKAARITWVLAGLFALVVFASFLAMDRWSKTHPVLISVAFISLVLGYVVALLLLILWTNRTQRHIRREEAAKLPTGASACARTVSFQPFEYRSRWMLLGLPLIHVRMECIQDGKTLPAKGWIAVGNIAYGILFAFGGLAVGPVSMGGLAIGVVAIGGSGLGLISFAGIAFGVWAIGGAAVGYLAFGGTAMAWLAASGGSAMAHTFAVGGIAIAQHANDEAARAFVHSSAFFAQAGTWMRHAALLIWLPMLLIVWQVSRMKRLSRRYD